LPGWFQWRPTSAKALEDAESKILSYLKTSFRRYYVNVGNKVGNEANKIWTLVMSEKKPNTPLVLVHGFGSGVALWALNLDALATKRPVYAFDILGFGRSSRPSFSSDPMEAETQFVESIEEWRKEVGLEDFILLGHSMGGFLAAAYTLRHPQHVKHLILADPWGFQDKPTDHQQQRPIPLWAKAVITLLQPFNPLAGLRAAGPLGPKLVDKMRPDLKRKFSILIEDEGLLAIPNYIYHCNAQSPSGETAFKSLTSGFGWAKNPMASRIGNFARKDIPITLMYGEKSWIDRKSGHLIEDLRKDSYVKINIIEDAGHHVYADNVDEFNKMVLFTCDYVDDDLNNQPRKTTLRDNLNRSKVTTTTPADDEDCLNSTL